MRLVGAARGGRIAAIAAGLADRRPGRVLVVAPTRESALRCGAEIEAGDPDAHLVAVVGGGNTFSIRTPGKLARRAVRSVVVGTARAVFKEFGKDDAGKGWLMDVDAVVFYDFGFVRETACFREVRALVRICIERRETRPQVVVVLDDAPPDLVKKLVPFILSAKHETVRWFDAAAEEEDAGGARRMKVVVVPEVAGGCTMALARSVGQVDGKVLVYFASARVAQMYATLVGALLGREVLEVHNQRSARNCSRALAEFRTGEAGILFATDQVSKGAELDKLAAVMQVGLPRERDHVARMALLRGGGSCTALLYGFETAAYRALMESTGVEAVETETLEEGDLEWDDPFVGMAEMKDGVVEVAIQSWLSFYFAHLKTLGWSREALVVQAAQWARLEARGDGVPPLQPRTIKRMGLKGVSGIEVFVPPPEQPKRKIGPQGKAFSKVKARAQEKAEREARAQANAEAFGSTSVPVEAGAVVASPKSAVSRPRAMRVRRKTAS